MILPLSAGLMLVACLPREELSSYSTDWGRAEIGMNLPANGVGGSTASAPPVDVGSGGNAEPMPGKIPLDPPDDAVSRDDAGPATPAQPDAEAANDDCGSSGEFARNGFGGDSIVSCYLLASEALSWTDARDACRSWGGDLVSINSAAEDQFLAGRFAEDVWIGVNDLDDEGTMVWSDGSPLNYTNWGATQPDDFEGLEDCGEIRVPSGTWNDRPCTGTPQLYLCER